MICESIRIVEEEALTLHALMMTSNPSYILMEPQTIEAIRAIRAFRRESDIPVCFTLDAELNIRACSTLLPSGQVEIQRDAVLRPLCEEGRIIEDHVGQGPERLAPQRIMMERYPGKILLFGEYLVLDNHMGLASPLSSTYCALTDEINPANTLPQTYPSRI